MWPESLPLQRNQLSSYLTLNNLPKYEEKELSSSIEDA